MTQHCVPLGSVTLAHTTRIAVTIAIEDDSGRVASFLVALTALVGLLVQLGQFVANVALLVSDAIEAVTFTAKVFTIGFKALSFGLGLSV